jgi:hypothetical protein
MSASVVALIFFAWLLLGAVLTLLLGDFALRRKRPSLIDRLRIYHHRSVADQASEWLREQEQRGS